MTTRFLASVGALAALVMSLVPASAQESGSGTKIALISIQQAILASQEGQAAAKELEERFKPRQESLQELQSEIDGLRGQLQRGSNMMSEEARRRLARDIETKERALRRDDEDARAEFNAEQQKVFNEIGGRMMSVVDNYANEKGYQIVMDISQQSPVLYAVAEVNITKDIVELYDAAHPSGETAAAAPAPSTTASP